MKTFYIICLALAFNSLTGCTTAQPALKDAFKNQFFIGAALNEVQFSEQNPAQTTLIKKHFNSITPENILKWESVHPEPGRYVFEAADRYVAFGEKNRMFIIGHTLVWHNQTPPWVFQDDKGNPANRETLLNRLRDHIHTVVGRYKGRIGGWDVVNEALNEDGTLRPTSWMKIIGEEYLLKAFQFAHEADPGAELYYNDFSLENPAKRDGAAALIKKLQAQGARVSGIGSQDHVKMESPAPAQVEAMIETFSRLGVKVMITELDVDVLPRATPSQSAEVSMKAELEAKTNPYTNGLPDSIQQKLAQRYAALFAAYLKYPGAVTRVTFWGVTDGDSWLNDWPAKGRTSHPLLFDRQARMKPAYESVIKTAIGIKVE